MHFVFSERRYWERSCTHTFVAERDPDFGRLVRTGTGRVRRFVHVWLAGRDGAEAYVGGVWARSDGGRRRALRRIARNVVRHVGRDAAEGLLRRLARHLAAFEREAARSRREGCETAHGGVAGSAR